MPSILIKTADELARQRRAGELLASVFAMLDEFIQPGVTTMEINDRAEDFIVNQPHSRPASKGQYERWFISGKGDMMLHPFHIHGTQFRIVSENGKPPATHRAGWKDTVRVEGDVSEVLVKFDHDAPKEHAYMAHCHLLEHEDTGMMLGFTV